MKNKINKNTESLILEAAKSEFQSKGMEGARMQNIADEAGINKAMLHYYYRSKQLLFEAVFKNAFSLLAPQLNTILNDDSSIEEKVRSFSSNYISFIIQHPYLPNFIIQELNRNPAFMLKMKENSGFPNLEKFKKQVGVEVAKGFIRKISAEQLFINILALNVFPFVAKPLIKGLIAVDDEAFQQIIAERKTEVANFIINSIKI
ncbi:MULTISPECIES: TetR/AcrR family transcriptional regulator [unclassified Polaribacter]|jgi:AcrR family transcriptional regulator|uniref:TetR/AcrR family transcriptional regulator n=1 Tax=unclassified Polaribacter TaxID=196858 RepID=UPI0011BE3B6D|nr:MULTISPECIES: TetR/AcrR family transcriptional regulator [unclassified Polaribacter]TXD50831.1 TetR/AcrR family transcriptional regulator [Polaribacter sp. IC063]TXD57610.1 TetR/AcrR family transcriptional regulator [Polaribacter sp. IC066]